MAQKVMLIDDLDGSEGAETITYTVDGQEYEIDLSEENAEKFRTALAPFIEKSRTVERSAIMTLAPGRSGRRQSSGGRGRDDIPQIRAWAESQGLEVSARGRIKKEIIDAYDQAHG
jgi:Lsr2